MIKEREALEKIVREINRWGGEDAATNYQLLVNVRRIASNALADTSTVTNQVSKKWVT